MKGILVVLVLALACCGRPALPAEATEQVLEDIRIPPEPIPTVDGLAEGQHACAIIFFTPDGTPFLYPHQRLTECWYSSTVWKSHGRIMGKLIGKPTKEVYVENPPTDFIRVWLVERP